MAKSDLLGDVTSTRYTRHKCLLRQFVQWIQWLCRVEGACNGCNGWVGITCSCIRDFGVKANHFFQTNGSTCYTCYTRDNSCLVRVSAVTRGVTSTCYTLAEKRELPLVYAKNAVEATDIGFSQEVGLDKFVSSVWMGLWPQRDHINQETSNDELPHIEEGDATARRNAEGAGESSVQAAASSGG